MSSKRNGFHSDLEINSKHKHLRANINAQRKSKQKGPYLMGDTIGEGAFAKVKVAVHMQTNEKVAIKILDKDKTFKEEEDIERVQKEIDILKKLKHKNIIQLYEIMESKKNLYIVMEYCEGKELFDYIVKKKKLPEMEACKFFQEIINALEYLHENNITHRDLKPENLLLDYKKSVKISDFGLSNIKTSESSLLGTPCGTPNYAPPEMLRGDEYNGLLSDVWSCGIILYAMLCGYLPFSESKEQIIYQKIIDHEYEYPNFLSKHSVDLLKNILKIEPSERFDIVKIKKHPWFNITQPVLRPGITIGKINIPIDEKILKKVETLGFDKEKCRQNLLNNKYDSITTIYYLCLKKFIKEGGKSISDLNSNEYLNYIKNEKKKSNSQILESEYNTRLKYENTKENFFSNNVYMSKPDISVDYKKEEINQSLISEKTSNLNLKMQINNLNYSPSKEEFNSNNPDATYKLSLNDTVVKLTHQQSNANLNKCDEAYKDLAFEKTLIEINNEQKSTINIESEISNKASHFRENLPRKQENNQQNFQKILLNEKEKTLNRTNSEFNETSLYKKTGNKEDNHERIIEIIARINKQKKKDLINDTDESYIQKNQIPVDLTEQNSNFDMNTKVLTSASKKQINQIIFDKKPDSNYKFDEHNQHQNYSFLIQEFKVNTSMNNLNKYSNKNLISTFKKKDLEGNCQFYEKCGNINKMNNHRIHGNQRNSNKDKMPFINLSEKNVEFITPNKKENSKLIKENAKLNTKISNEGIISEGIVLTEINQRINEDDEFLLEFENSNKIYSNPEMKVIKEIKNENSDSLKNVTNIEKTNKKIKQNVKSKNIKYSNLELNQEQKKESKKINGANSKTISSNFQTKIQNQKETLGNKKNSKINKKTLKKSIFDEMRKKKLKFGVSKLITPNNPSFISRNNELQSENKILQILEKSNNIPNRNSICIPDSNFSEKLNKIINPKDSNGNPLSIRNKLKEYSSSFVEQEFKKNIKSIKDSTIDFRLMPNPDIQKPTSKLKQNKELNINKIFSKENENLIKEQLKEREKEIRQNRIIIQQRNKVNFNGKISTPVNYKYCISFDNKNIFSSDDKEIKKNKEQKNINTTVEKVEINLNSLETFKKNLKSPLNMETKKISIEERFKNLIKNKQFNISPDNIFNSGIPDIKDSLSNKIISPDNRSSYMNFDRKLYSSFHSSTNNNNLLQKELKVTSSKNSKINQLLGTNEVKSSINKNNYLTNHFSNAFNSNSEKSKQNDLNEFLDIRPTESNVDFEIEEYEEMSKMKPNIKVLEFIAQKLVEKSNHLDDTSDSKLKSNNILSQKIDQINLSDKLKFPEQSRKCSMESTNTFIIKNEVSDFENAINTINKKYKNIDHSKKIEGKYLNAENYDISSSEKINGLIHNKNQQEILDLGINNINNNQDHLRKAIVSCYFTDKAESKYESEIKMKNVKKHDYSSYNKSFIEKNDRAISQTNNNKNLKIDEKLNNYNALIHKYSKDEEAVNKGKNKNLKKIPSKSKMDVKRKTNSKSTNKNKIIQKKKKFNNEDLLMNLKIPNRNNFINKRTVNVNIKKFYDEETERKPIVKTINSNRDMDHHIKAVKDSINRVNITNNLYNNKNIILDISATYDPDLDSRGETSVDRRKSKSIARRSYSINDNNHKHHFSMSPKDINNKLVSINEDYKDEINESFNNKMRTFKNEGINKTKIYNGEDLNLRIVENSNEIISNFDESLYEKADNFKNISVNDLQKKHKGNSFNNKNPLQPFTEKDKFNKPSNFIGIVSENEELNINLSNQKLKDNKITIVKESFKNDYKQKDNFNNINYKNLNIENNKNIKTLNNTNYLTENRVVTIDLVNSSVEKKEFVHENIKKPSNIYNTIEVSPNNNKNKQNKGTNSNILSRIPNIDNCNINMKNKSNLNINNLNKYLQSTKNENKLTDGFKESQNNSINEINLYKVLRFKSFNKELNEFSNNIDIDKIQANLNLERGLENEDQQQPIERQSHLKELSSYDTKLNNKFKNNNNFSPLSKEKNEIEREDINKFNNEIYSKDISGARYPSININNIHIKNINLNTNSDISKFLNLVSNNKNCVKNGEFEQDYETRDSKMKFEIKDGNAKPVNQEFPNNPLYMNTDNNHNLQINHNIDNEKDIQKPFIQVRKYSEKIPIERNLNKKILTLKKDNCYVQKNSDKIIKIFEDENNINYDKNLNNQIIPIQENLNKFNKNNANRRHIKTHSAFELNAFGFNLQNILNQNFGLKNNLKKEIKIFDCLQKSEKNAYEPNFDIKPKNIGLNSDIKQDKINPCKNKVNSSNIQNLKSRTMNTHKKSTNTNNPNMMIDTYSNEDKNTITPPLTTKNMGYSCNNLFKDEKMDNFKNIILSPNNEFTSNNQLYKKGKIVENLALKSTIPKTTKNKLNLDKNKFQFKSIDMANCKNILKEFRKEISKKHSNSHTNLQDFLKVDYHSNQTNYKEKTYKMPKDYNKDFSNIQVKNNNPISYNSVKKNVIIENIDLELDTKNEKDYDSCLINEFRDKKSKINNKSLSLGDLSKFFNRKKYLFISNQLKSPQEKEKPMSNKNENKKEIINFANKNQIKSTDSLNSNFSLGSQNLSNKDFKIKANKTHQFSKNIIKSTLKDFKYKQTGLKRDLYEIVKNGYKNLFNNNKIKSKNNNFANLMFKSKDNEFERQIKTTRNNFDKRIEFINDNLDDIYYGLNNCTEKSKNVNIFNSQNNISKKAGIKSMNLKETKIFNNSSSNLINKLNSNNEKLIDICSKTGQNFISNKNNNLKINTNYNTNNSDLSITNTNFFSKNSTLLSNRNEKVKVFELFNKENEKLKIYEGPVDINFISFNQPKILVSEYINILNSKKITFIQTSPYKLRCTKNGLSFNIEIFKLENTSHLYFTKIKQMQGEKEYFRKILQNFISN